MPANTLDMMLTALVHQSPLLLVNVIGLLLPLLLWQRCPRACVFAFTGSGLLLFTTVGWTLLWPYLIHLTVGQGGNPTDYQWYMSVFGFISNVLHAVGLAFLLAAIFIGRKQPDPWRD